MPVPSLKAAATGFYQRHPRISEWVMAAGLLGAMMYVARPAEEPVAACSAGADTPADIEMANAHETASEIGLDDGSVCVMRFEP